MSSRIGAKLHGCRQEGGTREPRGQQVLRTGSCAPAEYLSVIKEGAGMGGGGAELSMENVMPDLGLEIGVSRVDKAEGCSRERAQGKQRPGGTPASHCCPVIT